MDHPLKPMIKFRPRKRIVKFVKTRDVIVFYPTVEYEGTLYADFSGAYVLAKSTKYEGIFKIDRKDVRIVKYL